jgi:hypothetical protein
MDYELRNDVAEAGGRSLPKYHLTALNGRTACSGIVGELMRLVGRLPKVERDGIGNWQIF